MSVEGRYDELGRALVYCYGEVPPDWLRRIPDILVALDGIPPMEPGVAMPAVTYFLYVINRYSLAKMMYFNSVFSKDTIKAFVEAMTSMKEVAAVEAAVDYQNFKAEAEAFGDIEGAIVKPHLDISPLYRYMVAIQRSYMVLITDELFEQAKRQIRMNPYLFTAYGKEHEALMPLTWEEI